MSVNLRNDVQLHVIYKVYVRVDALYAQFQEREAQGANMVITRVQCLNIRPIWELKSIKQYEPTCLLVEI